MNTIIPHCMEALSGAATLSPGLDPSTKPIIAIHFFGWQRLDKVPLTAPEARAREANLSDFIGAAA